MNVYYILSSDRLQKYDMTNIATKSEKTISELQANINQIERFCREETSIETSELVGYLDSGITLYVLDSTNALIGVLNFDINGDKINILGLCAPEPSVGVGSLLINAVKKFAEKNGMKTISLTCYGNVVDFYTNPLNGFRIQSKRKIIEDSDDDSGSEEENGPSKMRYELSYHVFSGGRRHHIQKSKRVNSQKSRKTRKSRKSRKSRKTKKSRKSRK